MIAATSSGTPYIEADEKAMECSFRSLEFVNAMYVKKGEKISTLKLSKVTHLGIKQMPNKEAQAGKGLRKQLQGMLRPIVAIQKKIDSGWDTSPTDEKGRGSSKKRDKRESPVSSKKRESAKMDIPPLNCYFRSSGFVYPELIQDNGEKVMVDVAETFASLSIDMVEVEDQGMRNTGLPPFPHGQALNNWTSIELPVVFKFQNE